MIIGSCPAVFRAAQMSAVRRSCQTIAGWIGWPVLRSQISTVSRWLVMPMAAMEAAVIPAFSMAARAVAATVDQRSAGSCSTQPGWG